MVIYEYSRHHAPGEREVESLHEAMVAAKYDLEYNEAYPKRIIDGDKVFDIEDMETYWHENKVDI